MTKLLLHGKEIHTVFQLLGKRENDLTFSLGWALSQSPRFLTALLQSTLSLKPTLENITIRLQESEGATGITDIEIESPGQFFLIVEAKCGWNLPGKAQLEKYARRKGFKINQNVPHKILVLSECSHGFAVSHLTTTNINGTEVEPISWKQIHEVAIKARNGASHAEKSILYELLIYLRGVMTMQNVDSNWVFVVSLGNGTPEGWRISWIDIVAKRQRYFHRVGKGWPKEPPNYIAFRYYGKLQSIHHVDGYSVFDDPHEVFAEIPSQNWGPHFLYKLGEPFAPLHEVKTGKIYPSGRVWCMLDTLLVAKTISDARDVSAKRAQQGP